VVHGRGIAAKPSDFHFERVGDASGVSITTECPSAPFGSLGRQSVLIRVFQFHDGEGFFMAYGNWL